MERFQKKQVSKTVVKGWDDRTVVKKCKETVVKKIGDEAEIAMCDA